MCMPVRKKKKKKEKSLRYQEEKSIKRVLILLISDAWDCSQEPGHRR